MRCKFEENDSDRDLAKACILARYARAWGAPARQTTCSLEDSLLTEIYIFESPKLIRYVTLGLREYDCFGDPTERIELVLVLARADPNSSEDFAMGLLSDVVANIAHNHDAMVFPHLYGPCTNRRREPPCVLLDEAIGEPEDLARFDISGVHINLVWLVPIFESEYRMIRDLGIDEFDQRVRAHNIDLVCPSRLALA